MRHAFFFFSSCLAFFWYVKKEQTIVVETTEHTESGVRPTVHLHYICPEYWTASATWDFISSFIHFSSQHFFLSTTKHFCMTKYLDVDAVENKAFWFLSRCFCCEKRGCWWILCHNFLTNISATLRCRLPTVSISSIFVYLSAVLLLLVNLPNIGSTLCL